MRLSPGKPRDAPVFSIPTSMRAGYRHSRLCSPARVSRGGYRVGVDRRRVARLSGSNLSCSVTIRRTTRSNNRRIPMFDPAYAVAGSMLWNRPENRVAFEVYRAQSISGFETVGERPERILHARQHGVDLHRRLLGVSETAERYLRRVPAVPAHVRAGHLRRRRADRGAPLFHPAAGRSRPRRANGFYSDRILFHLRWLGAQYVRIIVYADKNGNRVFDGEPTVSTFMEDLTIPTEERTWGSVKALYGDR